MLGFGQIRAKKVRCSSMIADADPKGSESTTLQASVAFRSLSAVLGSTFVGQGPPRFALPGQLLASIVSQGTRAAGRRADSVGVGGGGLVVPESPPVRASTIASHSLLEY